MYHSPTQPNVESEMMFSLLQGVSEGSSVWRDRQIPRDDDIRSSLGRTDRAVGHGLHSRDSKDDRFCR